ncbi:MAG: hypothetical protein M3132_06050 [Actinomycetia bacterium]|nr:hypothetical protein [Actinomycetes bacterium]
MQDHGLIRFTTDPHVSVPNVRAPACPIDDGATLMQVLVAFAGIPLFFALVIAALTRDPVSLLGAGLAIVGLAISVVVFVGLLGSRFRPRGLSHPQGHEQHHPH